MLFRSLSTNFSDAGVHTNSTTPMYQCNLQFKKKDFCFVPFDSDSIIYDEYMERENLGKAIKIPNDELTVDLHGTRNKNMRKKFFLSAEILDFKVIASYAYDLRPIEANVLLNIPGSIIKLYDTTQYVRNSEKFDLDYYRMVYNMRYNEPIKILNFAFKVLLHNMNRIKNIPRRIRRTFLKKRIK